MSQLYPVAPVSIHELFDTYFTHVHPFFPILDRFYITQALQYDSDLLPASFRWSVKAVALYFTQHTSLAASYYHQASIQLDQNTPNLLSLQTLFILYKYQELITPVGAPLSAAAVGYLKEIQIMIQQLKQQTMNDEFLNRAGWILYIIVSMSSTADERWRVLFDKCIAPTRLPSLTESEQYDKGELNTTCNLIHLVNIAQLYSQTLCLISDQSTLFIPAAADRPEFTKLAADLKLRKSRLPLHIAISLTAQNHTASHNSPFTAYICLIYDILDLLICIHQSSLSSIAKKASQIYYRSHSFTAGDIYSRMASIQGSRIISFGLTLALQAHSYCRQQNNTLEDIKRYYASYMLSFQIFDDMTLSPQLYTTIQTLRSQIEASQPISHDDFYNMPSTPTFGMSPPSIDLDPQTPPSLVDMYSYFQSQQPSLNHPTQPVASSNFINHFSTPIQTSKHCKCKKII